MSKIDEDAYRERLERISALFSDMVGKAEKISSFRCPYRDRFDHCTAAFRCRSQQPATSDGSIPCGHDGTFDYRSAWESDPERRPRAKRKIDQIKRAADARRRPKGERTSDA